VKLYGSEPLYDPDVLRTIFLDFEDANWEAELMAFWHTDVELPAKMTVDGTVIKEVAVHFRGSSSFMMVPAGRKHSINIDVDYGDKQQRLLGYKSLELLNSNGDPTFMRAVLFDQMARKYMVAPKANFMRVVINGENWGIYQNTQAFNADLIRDNFQTKKGNRWKVPGNPGAQAGLAYIGDDAAAYKKHYEIKTKDDPKAWADLIHLTKVLSQTPPDQLEQALQPILDVDGALKFLAMDKAAINTDGFWVRMSDYSIYEDEKGKFHIIPHDANETFREPEGGRGFRGPTNAELDPFAGADDSRKALLNRLLAVPALRTKYLTDIRDVARDSFDWTKMEPIVNRYEAMLAADVKADGHKLFSTEMFKAGLYEENPNSFGGPTGAPRLGLKPFFEQRRAYLLNYPEIKKLPN
jgi:spore coat protein CotH